MSNINGGTPNGVGISTGLVLRGKWQILGFFVIIILLLNPYLARINRPKDDEETL
ncbi:hypothetical protein ACNO7M_05300 [Bisgaard Taxon 45]